jgi:formylmethanofuran dehydrogenase subunit E
LNHSPGRKQTISLSKNIATRNQEPSNYKCSKCHGYLLLSGKYRIGEEIVCLSCKSAQSLKEKSFPERYF